MVKLFFGFSNILLIKIAVYPTMPVFCDFYETSCEKIYEKYI